MTNFYFCFQQFFLAVRRLLRFLHFGVIAAIFLLVALAPKAEAVPSFELPPWWWSEDSGTLSANFDYLSTKANYTETRGGTAVLSSGNSYTSYEGTLRGRYSFDPLISAYVGVGYANAMVVDGATNKNNAAISNGFLGADFKLPFRAIRIIPEIEAGFAGQQFDINDNVPLTSDGTPYLKAAVYFNKPFHVGPTLIEPFLYGGFYYPTSSLAKLFIYGVGGELYFTRSIAIGGSIDGYETMMGDTDNETDRNRVEVDADGGSYRFNAFNPASAAGKGWVRLNFAEQFSVKASYAQTFTGIRSAFTQVGSLFVSFDFPEGNGVRSRSSQPAYPAGYPAPNPNGYPNQPQPGYPAPYPPSPQPYPQGYQPGYPNPAPPGYYGQPQPLAQPPPPDPHQQQLQNQRLFNQRVRQGSPDTFEADDFPEAVAPAIAPQQPVAPQPAPPPPQQMQTGQPRQQAAPGANEPTIVMKPRKSVRRAKPAAPQPPPRAVAPDHSLDDTERALEEKRVK